MINCGQQRISTVTSNCGISISSTVLFYNNYRISATSTLHLRCPQLRTWLPGVSGGQEAIVDEFVSQLETGEGLVGAAQQLAGDCRLLTPFVPLSGARRLNVSIRRNSWLSQLISQFQRLFLFLDSVDCKKWLQQWDG